MERRQRGEPEVHLRNRAGGPIVAHLGGKFRGQLCRVNELKEGRPRIQAGHNSAAFDFVSVCDNRGDALIVNDNALDGDAGTDFGTGSARGSRHRIRDRPRSSASANRSSSRAAPARFAQKQHEGAARGPRTEHCARDARSCEHCLQPLILEPFRHQVGNGHRQPAEETIAVALAE